MKKSLFILCLLFLTKIVFCQFADEGLTFGVQLSRNNATNGYYSFQNQLMSKSDITNTYNDRYNFLHFDCRYLSTSDNFIAMVDASGVADLLVVLEMKICTKQVISMLELGAMNYVTNLLRLSARLDQLWKGEHSNQKGFGFALDSDLNFEHNILCRNFL